jgi:cytochrome c oxidase cbb3-type subunit 3
MYFRYLVDERRVGVKSLALSALVFSGCTLTLVTPAAAQEPNIKPIAVPAPAPAIPKYTVDSALTPGVGHTAFTVDPRAAKYYDNQEAVNTGKLLFGAMNCSGCHTNGGGGIGPSLMDSLWIYGGRLEQIHQTIADGRPNGMPSWGARLSDSDMWKLAAYVRSMSLPATLAAQGSGNPSQSPAPVPRAADEDPGWSAPAATTNDYSTTLKGGR